MRDLEEWNCSIYEKSIYGDEKVKASFSRKNRAETIISFSSDLDQTTTAEVVQYQEDHPDGGEESVEDEVQFCFQEPDWLQSDLQ